MIARTLAGYRPKLIEILESRFRYGEKYVWAVQPVQNRRFSVAWIVIPGVRWFWPSKPASVLATNASTGARPLQRAESSKAVLCAPLLFRADLARRGPDNDYNDCIQTWLAYKDYNDIQRPGTHTTTANLTRDYFTGEGRVMACCGVSNFQCSSTLHALPEFHRNFINISHRDPNPNLTTSSIRKKKQIEDIKSHNYPNT